MKKVLEFSAKVTIAVMVGLILLGLGFFVYSTYPDVIGSITDFDDDAQQTAVWVGICSAIAIGIIRFISLGYTKKLGHSLLSLGRSKKASLKRCLEKFF